MKPKTYKLLEQCVDNGVRYGLNRAEKHTEETDFFIADDYRDNVIDSICQNVLVEITEWFNFDDFGEQQCHTEAKLL